VTCVLPKPRPDQIAGHRAVGEKIPLQCMSTHCQCNFSTTVVGGTSTAVLTLVKALAALLPTTHLTWNALRHVSADAVMRGNLTAEEVDGIATQMLTSKRKLEQVYQNDRHLWLADVGAAAYEHLGGRRTAVLTGERTAVDRVESTGAHASTACERPEQDGSEADDDSPGELALATLPRKQLDIDTLEWDVAAKRGRSVVYKATGEYDFLTAEQVQSLKSKGNRALMAAFKKIYGQECTKGGAWLERKLQRE